MAPPSCSSSVPPSLASPARSFSSPIVTPEPVVWFAFFLIGFGPMLWLVTQTSLRQSVTPAELMGRVGATIQAAIYGVRPLGALAAGTIAAHFGLGAAAAIPLLFFAASLASMVVLLRSALGSAVALPTR